MITNCVTVDSVVCVDTNSSVVVSDVEGTAPVLVVDVSSKLGVDVVADSVLTEDVSMGKIIITTNISVSLFTPRIFKVIGTFWGSPNIWTSLGPKVQRKET